MLISSNHRLMLIKRLNISEEELEEYPGISFYQKSSWALREALAAFDYDELVELFDVPYGTEIILDLEPLVIMLKATHDGVYVADEAEIQTMLKEQFEADKIIMEKHKQEMEKENEETSSNS